jgi:hypothetical protein
VERPHEPKPVIARTIRTVVSISLLVPVAAAAQDTWSLTGPLAEARRDHAATLLADGKVLVVGGSAVSTAAELYDPATGRFSATGAMVAAHGGGLTATRLADGRVLVAGGSAARRVATAALLRDGRVLVAGGDNLEPPAPLTCVNTAEIYDPATGTFSASVTMTAPRCALWWTDAPVLASRAG